jgi:glycoside/pentoside/hexuronide:cation symporter, GPH family
MNESSENSELALNESNEIVEIIPMKTKMAYGIGVTGSNIMAGIVFASITFFYNIKLGLDTGLLGIAWLIFGIWNTINDPLFGQITDNTRNKLGRRVPFIRYGSVFYGLMFILCWYPLAPLDDQTLLFLNFLLVLILFDTMYSIVGTCYFCLPAEMASTSKQRGSIGLISSALSILAILVQFTIPVFLLTGDDTSINPLFQPVMIFVAILSSSLIFVTSYYIKENKFVQEQDQDGFWEGLKKTFKNKPFFLFEISNFSMTLLVTILTTGIYYYIDYVLDIDLTANQFGVDLVLPVVFLLIGLVSGAILTLKKIETWQPRRLAIFSFSLVSVGMMIFFFTARNLLHSIPVLFILALGCASVLITVPALIGDVIDHDEILTGKRREGVYAGFNAILTKPAISIANWLFLIVIDNFGFQRPIIQDGIITQVEQSESAIIGILLAMTIIPASFSLLSVIGMYFYTLDGELWQNQKKKLRIAHMQKEKEYLEKIMTINESPSEMN